MPKTSTRPKRDVIGAQHRRLRESVAELRSFLAKACPTRDARNAAAWKRGLAERLTAFSAEVRRHFRTEERSGMLEQMGACTPSSTRAIARLLAEHERILADLREAKAANAAEAKGKAARRADPRRLALAALERLEQHDHAENELIQSLVCDDIGAGD